jgi:hypothetical protein
MAILCVTSKRNCVTTVKKFYVNRQTDRQRMVPKLTTKAVSENKLFDTIVLHELPLLYWGSCTGPVNIACSCLNSGAFQMLAVRGSNVASSSEVMHDLKSQYKSLST